LPDYLFNIVTWQALWPLVAFPFLSALVILAAFDRTNLWRNLGSVFALSLLGIVTGQITGLSRSGAVGDVLPAVLGLLGGLTLYLIGTKGRALQSVVAAGVIGLTLNLIVGIYWGSHSRQLAERDPGVVAAKAVAKENARHLSALQKLLNDREYADLEKALKSSSSQ
jgi:hypothetical protein